MYKINLSIERKVVKTLDVDFDAMPDNAKAYVIEYGLKQILNDVASDSAKQADPAAYKIGKATDKLANLMAGSIRTARTFDEFGKEIRKQVELWLRDEAGLPNNEIRTHMKDLPLTYIFIACETETDVETVQEHFRTQAQAIIDARERAKAGLKIKLK